jgi:hypothetical protein
MEFSSFSTLLPYKLSGAWTVDGSVSLHDMQTEGGAARLTIALSSLHVRNI